MLKSFKSYPWVLWLLFFSRVCFAQTTVYLKPVDAIKLIFKDSQEVIKEDKILNDQDITQFKKLLGYDPPKDRYSFFIGKTQDHTDAYALIDEQIGKVLPITFITRINPEGKVDAVEVMVYRESHGGEVSSRRFLNQFKQKGLNDELRLHGNIINITGATLSARSLVVGVNRALTLWQIFYGKK